MPPVECTLCHENTARKKGTYTLKGGKKQQVWHCRSCGGTFQTEVPVESAKTPAAEWTYQEERMIGETFYALFRGGVHMGSADDKGKALLMCSMLNREEGK